MHLGSNVVNVAVLKKFESCVSISVQGGIILLGKMKMF